MRPGVVATGLAVLVLIPGSATAAGKRSLDQNLSVGVAGNGRVVSSPAGIDCPGACSFDFKDFEFVGLSAVADPGWHFAGWGGDCSGDKGCGLTMDTKKFVSAVFEKDAEPTPPTPTEPTPTTPTPTPTPPKPKPGKGPTRTLTFDPFVRGTRPSLPGISFGGDPRIFVPRNSAPFSAPHALGLNSCKAPGKGSELRMRFDPPLLALSLRTGVDDLRAPKGGTWARLVGYGKDGKPVADSGDVKIADAGRYSPIATELGIASDDAAIASAALVSGKGTAGHDTGPRCAAVDDIVITVPIDRLIRPSVSIDSPESGALFERSAHVRVSGAVGAPMGLEAFCLTAGNVPTMPAGCNLLNPIISPLRSDNTFRGLVAPPLANGRNVITAWVRDRRGQVASDSVTVEITGQPLTYDLLVRGIEVTQAVQQFALPQFTGTAEPEFLALYGITRRYPLAPYAGVTMAAQGRTIVRVFPQFVYGGTASLSGVSVRLYGFAEALYPLVRLRLPLDGNPLLPIGGPITLGPQTDMSDAALYRARTNPSSGFTFVLPSSWTAGLGGWRRIVAQIVPPPDTPRLRQENTDNDVAGLDLVPFQPMQTYRLSVVALDSTFGGNGRAPGLQGSSACGGYTSDAYTRMRAWFNDLEMILPLGAGQLRIPAYAGCVDITPIHRCDTGDRRARACNPTFDASGNRNDDPSGAINALVIGWNRTPVAGQVFGLGGFAPGIGVAGGGSGVSSTDNRPLTSVAHEVVHTLGRPHAGCPNSGGQRGEAWPPDEVGLLQGVGIDRRAGSGGTAGPFRIIAPNQSPSGQTCAPAAGADCTGTARPQFTDLMSYCLPGDPPPIAAPGESGVWISTRNWTTLLNRMRVGATSPPRGVGATRAPAAASAGPTLQVTALVDSAGRASIAGVRRGSGRPTASDSSSPYRIVVRNGAGAAVAAVGVTVEPPSDAGTASVVVAEVPAAGAARVELVYEGKVIAARPRSAHAPRVGPVKVAPGARQVEVAWKASDADGDPLTATVEYSADGGRTWRSVAAVSREPARLAGALFSRSADARVRVTVNDGFDEAAAVSPRFRAAGAPPFARISFPPSGFRIANDAALTLGGEAYDDRGNPLTGKRLRWLLGKRVLGTSPAPVVTGLPPGRQTIRLEARDASGRVGSASVAVRVFASAPQFTVLQAPARMSPRARSVKLTVASALPGRLSVGGKRYPVGRKPRTISVAVKPGKAPLVVRLRLSVAGKTSTRALTVVR